MGHAIQQRSGSSSLLMTKIITLSSVGSPEYWHCRVLREVSNTSSRRQGLQKRSRHGALRGYGIADPRRLTRKVSRRGRPRL